MTIEAIFLVEGAININSKRGSGDDWEKGWIDARTKYRYFSEVSPFGILKLLVGLMVAW